MSQFAGGTLKQEIYRPPAWRGLYSAPKVYLPAPDFLAEDAKRAFGLKGTAWQLQNVGGEDSFFLKLNAENESIWFIKIVNEARAPSLRSAESIATWIQERGIRVIYSLSSAQLGGRAFWLYPYHSGRIPCASIEDMKKIGCALGQLHNTLRRHPLSMDWMVLTARRLEKLSKIRIALASGELTAGPHPEYLRQIASDPNISFLPSYFDVASNYIVTHGDLNRFNMLIDDQGCTFLDFEDTPHSVLPAIFDLATIIERLILVERLPPLESLTLIEALMESYSHERGPIQNIRRIPEILYGLALRSLCTLTESDVTGLNTGEWEKFFGLIDIIKSQRDLFSRLGCGQ